MARARTENLVIGIGSFAVGIDPKTGDELWRTKLKSSSFVTIMRDGDTVYAGAGGELFCLHARTGELLWHNKLKGLGLGVIGFPGASVEAQLAASRQQQAGAAAAAGNA